MPTKAKKEELIAELYEKLSRCEAVFICEYRGLTVGQITTLRSNIRKAGGEMKVAKNTLMRIALNNLGLPTADEFDNGPNVYTLAYSDVAAVAKALRDFAREKGNEALIIKGAIYGKNVLQQNQVLALADLPSKEVLLAQVVGTLAAPLRGLVTVLSAPMRDLVTCLNQIAEQKEKAA